MTITNEERNERRKKRRFRVKQDARNRCIEKLENVYKNARRFFYEREFILQARKEIWSSQDFLGLPEIWREFVRGADHIFTRDFEGELEWVHIHPKTGKRTPRHDKSLEGHYREIEGDKSCFCYVLKSGKFVPIDKEHRTAEDAVVIKAEQNT